jgi:hypothetical protein
MSDFGYQRKKRPSTRVGFCYRHGGTRKVLLFPHPTSGDPALKFCDKCCDKLREGEPSRRQLAREYLEGDKK